jgi:hypothetical protein
MHCFISTGKGEEVLLLFLFLFGNFNSFVKGLERFLQLGVRSVHFLILRSSFNLFSSIYSAKAANAAHYANAVIATFLENAEFKPKIFLTNSAKSRKFCFLRTFGKC